MNKFLKRAGAMVLATVLAVTPAIGVMAAPTDIIDSTRNGNASITVHKYDISAAEEDGFDRSRFTANGERDEAAEQALANYVIEGVEFSYVRVGNINTESVGGDVRLLYDIPPQLETALGLTDTRGDYKHDSTELNNALKAVLEGAKNTAGKNTLEKYIGTASNVKTMVTGEDGICQATGLSLGLYLLVETKVPANVHTTVDPFFVSVPMTNDGGEYWFYDIDVYPKNQTDIPNLDKLVRQHDDAELYNKAAYDDIATGSEGDRMDYLFVSHLPKITSESTYLTVYTFVDKMDKGLSYNKDAAIYFYDNEADARANNTAKAVKTWAHGAAQFSEVYEGSNSDYNQMTITPSREGLKEIDPSLSQHWLVVSYSATINSDATPVLGDSGNTNDVKLTWKRTNQQFEDTLEDRARVFTFGINLKKEFTDGSSSGAATGDATKVQFVLQNQTDGHYITAKKDRAGIYYVTDATKGAAEADGTVFSPATDGTMIINGLEANTYVLTEIHTSDGYSLLKEPMTIDIKCTEDEFTPSQTTLYDIVDISNNPHKNLIEVNSTRASATVDGKATVMSVDNVKNISSSNARVDMTITNTPNFKLPMTGGAGTLMFTLAGCAVAFVGIMVATKKSKKKAA